MQDALRLPVDAGYHYHYNYDHAVSYRHDCLGSLLDVCFAGVRAPLDYQFRLRMSVGGAYAFDKVRLRRDLSWRVRGDVVRLRYYQADVHFLLR